MKRLLKKTINAMRIIHRQGVTSLLKEVARRSSILFGSALIGPREIQINPHDFFCNHSCPMCSRLKFDSQSYREKSREDQINGMVLADYD